MRPATLNTRGASIWPQQSRIDLSSLNKAFGPSIEAAIPFEGVRKLFYSPDLMEADVLQVHPVSQDGFRKRIDEYMWADRHFGCFYLSGIELLIITFKIGPTIFLRDSIIAHIKSQLFRMGIYFFDLLHLDHWYASEGSGVLSGDVMKEYDPDQPTLVRSAPDAWPTVLIHTGHAQTLQELRALSQWWLRAGFKVKIVIIVKYDEEDGTISIEKWKVLPRMIRPGARVGPLAKVVPAADEVTATVIEPRCTQAILLARHSYNQGMGPEAWTVTGGELRLEFCDLFLRDPTGGELDIVIDEGALRYMAAETMWQLG